MSAHTEKYENHAIHNNLKKVQEELEIVAQIENNSAQAIEVLARTSAVIENLAIALETCSVNLVAISWLDEASNSLNNIKNHLSTYKNNKDSTALTNNTNGSLSTILLATSKLNCVQSTQNFRGAASASRKYISFLDGQNAQLITKVKSLEDEIARLKESIDNHEQASTTNLNELKVSIDTEKQRLDTFAVSYQSQMAEDQKSFIAMSEKLKESFATTQEERKNSFNEQIENAKKQQKEIDDAANEQRKSFQNSGEQLIKEYDAKFNEFEKQVENIVGIVNTNMFSYKYKEVADDAHKRARFWHGVAIALMLAVSVFAVYAFIISANADTSWVKLVAKIFATTTLVTGAAYAARQASKQEKVERYARKIEMELVAIDPFIASMDEERRSTIKEEISRKIFGNADAMEISTKDEAYTAMDKLSSIEDMVLSILKSVAKK